MQICSIVQGSSFSWLAVGIIWVACFIVSLYYWNKRPQPRGERFFQNWPRGTDRTSTPAWVVYLYACMSQLSPVGMLSRVVPARWSRLAIDLYILSWGALALVAVYNPEYITLWMPLFVWRFVEYTSIIIYQRIFRAGFPPRLEPDPERFRLSYRALIIDVVNYIEFTLMFAAVYFANSAFFNPQPKPFDSVYDAVYFSFITMTTTGYGDITPISCMRNLAVIQIFFGIFMIVIIIGVLIGQRLLYPQPDVTPPIDLLRRIKLFAMDFDGIHTTDAQVYTDQNGIESVRSSRIDGLGMELVRTRTDIQLRVISREVNPVVAARCNKLQIPYVQAVQTGEGKLQILQRIMQEIGVSQEETLYMGDDINDLTLLRYVALPISVPGGRPEVKAVCRYVTTAEGGNGAIREVCELLLRARGIQIVV